MSISVHLVSLGWPVCELAAIGSPLTQGNCIQGDWTTSLQGLEAGQFSLEEVHVLAGFHVRQTLQLWGKHQTKDLLLRVYGKTWWLRDAGHWERRGAEQLLDTRGSINVSFLPAKTSQPQPMRTGDLPRFPSSLGFSWHECTHLKALLVVGNLWCLPGLALRFWMWALRRGRDFSEVTQSRGAELAGLRWPNGYQHRLRSQTTRVWTLDPSCNPLLTP